MDTYFDKIFVINLDEREDRWKHAKEEFEKYNIKNYERFPAYKLTELPDPQLTKNFMSQSERYIKGAFGCRLSHIGAIKLAKERNYKNVLILEDDFMIRDNRFKYLNLAMNELAELNIKYDMLFLGITPYYHFLDVLGKYLYQVKGRCTGAHAYVVNNHFYDTILEKHNTGSVEIDNIYARDIQVNNKCYGIRPFIVFQYSNHSDIRGHDVEYSKK